MQLLFGIPIMNSGPRPCKYPCGYCSKTVKWTTPGICCDTCNIWYHQECLGMKGCVYLRLTNVSWDCVRCSSTLFGTLLFETSNLYNPLYHDTSAETDISFSLPQATSFSQQHRSHTPVYLIKLCWPGHLITSTDHLAHPSFDGSSQPVAVQRSLKQRDDIPVKVLDMNCHFIVDKRPMLENMI